MAALPSQLELRIDQSELISRLSNIKAWLFDWDGIFNDGHKEIEVNSSFSERDSMGINMLRFAHFLRTGQQPFCAIVTGATNKTARYLAEREHFHAIIPGALYKRDVVEILLDHWNIRPNEAAYFFDDILDLNVCEIVGLRVQVQYPSSQALNDFVIDNRLADVVSRTSGQNHAVRQICDYFISVMNQADDVISGRMHVDERYQNYFNSRQQILTAVMSRQELLNK